MRQQQNCPVGRTLSLISGKWKPLLLFLISHDINRFKILEKTIPGISAKVLTTQLRSLERYGLIVRHVHKSKHPQIIVYSLTNRGITLLELMDKIFDWGSDNLLEEPLRTTAKAAKRNVLRSVHAKETTLPL